MLEVEVVVLVVCWLRDPNPEEVAPLNPDDPRLELAENELEEAVEVGWARIFTNAG